MGKEWNGNTFLDLDGSMKLSTVLITIRAYHWV